MILIKENVERVAVTPAAIALLEKKGFKRLSLDGEETAGAELPVVTEAKELPENLAALKKADLVKLAADRGIKGASSLTKEELLKALR